MVNQPFFVGLPRSVAGALCRQFRMWRGKRAATGIDWRGEPAATQKTPHPAAMRGHPLPKVEGLAVWGVAPGGTSELVPFHKIVRQSEAVVAPTFRSAFGGGLHMPG